VLSSDYNWPDIQIRQIQTYLGTTNDLIGDGIAAAGIGGAVSAVADGNTAFQFAARNDFTSGTLLSVGDNYDTSYSEKMALDYAGDLTLAGGVLVADGAVGTPSVSFAGDPSTGLYQPSAGSLGVATSGNDRHRFGSVALYGTISGTYYLKANAAGSAATPTYAFNGDTITGWFSGTANTIQGACGGNRVMDLYQSASATFFKLARTDAHGDGASIGQLMFAGKDDGATEAVYAGVMGLCAEDAAGGEGGVLHFRVADSGNSGTVTQIAQVTENGLGVIDGGLYFIDETTTGFYRYASGVIRFTMGGADKWVMSATAFQSSVSGGGYLKQAAGVVGAPTYAFVNDTDTGWYGSAADTMALGTGGTLHSTYSKSVDIPVFRLYRTDNGHGDGVYVSQRTVFRTLQGARAVGLISG
jgi:hypothetical protein